MPLPRKRESGPRQARFPKSFITTTAADNLTEDRAMRHFLVARSVDDDVIAEREADRLVRQWLVAS